MLFFRSIALAALALAAQGAIADTVTGSAFYRERIAPPPDALFVAVLQDVTTTDGIAKEIGRYEEADAGAPPYDFEIEYDPAEIDQGHRYVVRATLSSNGQLAFTSDTVTPVITGGAPTEVDLLMVRVQHSPDAAAPADPANDQRAVRGLTLPATYTGTLPCADCEGIAHHLDLWPDHSYHLRRQWLGRDATAEAEEIRRDAIGLWAATQGSNVITLYGSDEPPVQVEALAPDTLRLLDKSGEHIESDLPYDLTSDGTLEETDIEHLLMSGMMTYMADAAIFVECISGHQYPVAMEGDYRAMEEAYLADTSEPGAPLYVEATGSLLLRPAMEGPDKRSFVPESFLRTRPGITCERQRADSSLANTYWRLDELQGEPVAPVGDAREPHMILHAGEDPRYVATVGCNQVTGSYAGTSTHLTFLPGAMTMMACPPPLDALEKTLTQTLPEVATYAIRGETLALYDDAETVLAIFTAVHFF